MAPAEAKGRKQDWTEERLGCHEDLSKSHSEFWNWPSLAPHVGEKSTPSEPHIEPSPTVVYLRSEYVLEKSNS